MEALKDAVQAIKGTAVFACSTILESDSFARDEVDVVVCDPTFDGRFRSDFVRRLRFQFGQCRLIVLISRADSSLIASSLANGAQSMLLKSESIEAIQSAIEFVCRGGVALSLPVAALMASSKIAAKVEPSLMAPASRGLSPREVEVISLVARGYNDSEIGEVLSISHRTAEQHVSNVLRKLDCRSRSEAVARVLGSEPPLARVRDETGDKVAVLGALVLRRRSGE